MPTPPYLAEAAISKQPLGMLHLLGLQNGGRFPYRLDDNYSPVIDFTEWLLETSTEVLQAIAPNIVASTGLQDISMNAATIASGTPLQVPAGEAWWVTHAEARFNIATGTSRVEGVSVCLVQSPNAAPTVQLSASSGPLVGLAALAVTIAAVVDRPFLMVPGATLALRHNGFTFAAGGNGVPVMTARIARMRV